MILDLVFILPPLFIFYINNIMLIVSEYFVKRPRPKGGALVFY